MLSVQNLVYLRDIQQEFNKVKKMKKTEVSRDLQSYSKSAMKNGTIT